MSRLVAALHGVIEFLGALCGGKRSGLAALYTMAAKGICT